MRIDQAIEIAAKAHLGQPDKAGKPYILQPLWKLLRAGGKEVTV